VFFREPGQARVRSLPARWTDVDRTDPFLVVAAGRAHFRPEDLLQLAHLLTELQRVCKPDCAAGVSMIMPAGVPGRTSRRARVHVVLKNEQFDLDSLTAGR
jgi:Family of unknown function (DUF5372)